MSSIATENSYTFERPMNDALRQELARTYHCFTTTPMTPHLPFRVWIVRQADNSDVGIAEAASFGEVMLEADRIMADDITTRGPVSAPEGWWRGAEVVR